MSIDNFHKQDSLEYRGVTFTFNDRVIIKGQHSKFFFRSYERNERTGADWVNVFEDNHCLRSFHLDKIVIKAPKKNLKKTAKIVVIAQHCVEHPKYTARRTPRTNCARCWAAYEENKKK